MVFDKGLKLDLVSTNSIIGRLTLQIYWCRWAFAAIPHGQQRQKKGTHELCNKHFHCGCCLFSSSQKLHGTIFWILFFFGMSYFPHVSLVDSPLMIESLNRVDSHHGITVPHGLPMGSRPSFWRVTVARHCAWPRRVGMPSVRHGIWKVKEAEKMKKKSGGLDSRVTSHGFVQIWNLRISDLSTGMFFWLDFAREENEHVFGHKLFRTAFWKFARLRFGPLQSQGRKAGSAGSLNLEIWILDPDGIDGPFRLFQNYQSVCFFVWRPVDSTLDVEHRHWRRGKLLNENECKWNFHMNQRNNIEFRCI